MSRNIVKELSEARNNDERRQVQADFNSRMEQKHQSWLSWRRGEISKEQHQQNWEKLS